jgi:hypothetical protein
MAKEKAGTVGELKVAINITVALLVIVLGAIFVTLYIFYPTHRDLLVFCAAVVGGLSAMYSAFHVGRFIPVLFLISSYAHEPSTLSETPSTP